MCGQHFSRTNPGEQEHNCSMDAAVRIVQMIRIALMVSVVLYALVGEMVGRNSTSTPDTSIYFAVTLAAVIAVALIVAMRRLFVLKAESTLTRQPEDQAALGRWRTGYIITYALSETVALFGLVLRFLGFTFSHVVTFYAVGLILMMFFGPRRPSHDMG
jgi:F0F1-type ATP synthase membrane subunit c/vacuolar-type H+-ATPase subunit K